MLARAESPFIELPRENIDLSIELQRLRDFYEVLMTEADIQWVVQSSAGITINANRPLLQRAIGNLIENALRHTPSGGTISVCAIPTDQSLRIEVADNGSGIPSKELPHVFDRFYCVDILMKISAATGALHKVGELVLEDHLKSCVRAAMENGDTADREKKLEELMTIFRKYR